MTWFGGEACVPRACLSSDSTMTIRVNAVISSSTAGRNVSAVSSSSVSTGSE